MLCCALLYRVLGFMSYTPEQLTTLQHVVQDMDTIREQRLKALGPDDVLGEPEPDVVKVRQEGSSSGSSVCVYGGTMCHQSHVLQLARASFLSLAKTEDC